jgi:hypothetical protein
MIAQAHNTGLLSKLWLAFVVLDVHMHVKNGMCMQVFASSNIKQGFAVVPGVGHCPEVLIIH